MSRREREALSDSPYFESIRGERLTRAEEYELGRKARKGDTEARNRMIMANQGLVVSVAKRYRRFGLPLMDLISAGNVGLLRATEMFDPDSGNAFSTYATYWIRQACQREIARSTEVIRIPERLRSIVRSWEKASSQKAAETGRQPDESDVQNQLGISDSTMTYLRAARAVISSGRTAGAEYDEQEHDVQALADHKDTPQIDHAVLMDEYDLAQRVLNLIEKERGPRDSQAVRLRFGLDDGKERTLEEVAKLLKITRERVRQVVGRTLKRIQVLMENPDMLAIAEDKFQARRRTRE